MENVDYKKAKNENYRCPKCSRSCWATVERLEKHMTKCGGKPKKLTRQESIEKIIFDDKSDKDKQIAELKSDIMIVKKAQDNTSDKAEKKRLSQQKYILNKKLKELRGE